MKQNASKLEHGVARIMVDTDIKSSAVERSSRGPFRNLATLLMLHFLPKHKLFTIQMCDPLLRILKEFPV